MLSTLTRMAARILAFLRPGPLDRELDLELEAHRAMLVDENRRRGMPEEEARRAARLQLGGPTELREKHRDVRGLPFFEELVRDVRYALRAFRRNPGFGAAAVLTLAMGIGANTAMFSVIDAVLRQPLDYPDPDNLVSIARANPGSDQPRWLSLSRVDALRDAARSFADVGAFLMARVEDVTISGRGDPETLKGARVSANFLDILRVRPQLGRGFSSDEDRPDGPAVAIISSNLWRRRFGADESVVGLTATFNATPYTIVGVLPPPFQFPSSKVDVWFTRPNQSTLVAPQFRACCVPLMAFARLKPGVTLTQASAELDVLSERYAKEHPRNLDVGPLRPTRLKDELTARVNAMLWMLLGAVALVLLIACANVATLLMARTTSRARELAVRAAIGAARGRLFRQLLTESLVLALAGGVSGLLLAWIALGVVSRMTIFELPRVDEIHMSGVVLAFTVGISMATGAVFGTVPALQILRPGLVDRLRQSGPADSGALGSRGTLGLRTRGALVVTQVALSMVLLIGAALMMKSLARLAGVDPGFRPDGLLTMRIPLPPMRYDTPEKRGRFFEEIVNRVERLPGVRGATVARSLPMTTGGLATNVQVVGFEIAAPGHLAVGVQSITPGYFKVLGIPLKRGRDFVARDNVGGAPPVAIINETLARLVWPGYPGGPDPVGQRLLVPILRPLIAGNGPLEIVGVAADVRELGPIRAANPQFYLPNVLYPPQTAYLAVRTGGDVSTAAAAIRAEVQAVDPGQSVADIRMMDEVSESFVGQRHLAARLLNLFAGAALLLVVVGIYGVLAYSVAQRTTEIGIRRALGAKPNDVLLLVLGQAARLTLMGVACGLAGAFALTRLLETLLFEVSATDLSTFAGVSVVFVVVALVAGLIPAWRAVRIDPMSALRVQ